MWDLQWDPNLEIYCSTQVHEGSRMESSNARADFLNDRYV